MLAAGEVIVAVNADALVSVVSAVGSSVELSASKGGTYGVVPPFARPGMDMSRRDGGNGRGTISIAAN